MPHPRLSLPLALAVALLIPAQAQGQRQADVEALNKLLDRYGALEDAMDMAGQAAMMSADRVWVGEGYGRRTDQAKNMAMQQAGFDAMKLRAPGIKFFTEDRDRLIKFHGNGSVAVVTFYRYRTAIMPPDAPEDVAAALRSLPPAVFTLVLEKVGSDWKIVHTHVSSLGPPTSD